MIAGSDRKKIALFMLPRLTHGAGAEKYFVNLAKNLSERGFDVDVITTDKKFYNFFCLLLSIFYLRKIRPIERESEESVKYSLGDANWIQLPLTKLRKVLSGYDVIYSKNELVDLLLLKIAGYKKLPPIIVGVHTPIFYPATKSFQSKLHNFLYLGFVYGWLLNGVSRVHLSNKFTKDIVDKNFKVKTKLIAYPFSVKEFSDKQSKYIFDGNFDDGKTNITFIARLTEQKGISDLIEIIDDISKIEESSNKININIFGDGELRGLIDNASNRYSFVKYFGNVENKFVPNILSKSDLFITTARWETLPFNVIEAQAMGVPVIAYNIPGPSDIIINGVTGYVVENKCEFVSKLRKFISDNAQFDSNIIRKNIDDKFDPNRIFDKLKSMIESS